MNGSSSSASSSVHDLDLASYDVHPIRGFLPPPLRPLQSSYFAPWERLAEDLSDLLSASSGFSSLDIKKRSPFAERVQELPLLSAEGKLSETDETEWRRAHSLLAFFCAGWIWGSRSGPENGPNAHIPSQLAIPFLETCEHLGIVPTTTYAGLALFNWTASSGNLQADVEELKNPDNLTCLLTFTGTSDEEWFYLISVAIEAAGGPALGLFVEAMQAMEAEGDQEEKVTDLLRRIGEKIEETWKLLDRIYEGCSASVFYNHMRPYWAGYKGTEKLGSLPGGIVYHLDDTLEGGETRTYKHDGGSAAQSSLYHLFDAGLGVKHLTGTLKGMRDLMPRKHREFLSALEERASIRDYVMRKRAENSNKEIVKVYDDAVHALTTFRDAHIRMATKYIAKASKEPSRPGTPANLQEHAEDTEGREAARGTGGQPFLPFLKQSRDETKAAGMAVR